MIEFGYINGPWRNDACIGYALLAMRRAGVDEETIEKVIDVLCRCFDDTSVDAAAEYLTGGERK